MTEDFLLFLAVCVVAVFFVASIAYVLFSDPV